MKQLRLLLSFFILFSATSAAFSQDAKADAIIKASKAKFNALKDVSAELSYSLSNPNLDKPIIKKGTIVLSGEKFKILFPQEEIYCNAKYVWVVMKGEEEVTKTCFDPEESINVNSVYKLAETKSKSRYEGVEVGLDKITLFSTDEYSDFFKSEVWINSTTKLIEKAKLYGRNGSVYEYKMTNIKSNTGSITPTTFDYKEAGSPYYLNDLTDDC